MFYLFIYLFLNVNTYRTIIYDLLWHCSFLFQGSICFSRCMLQMTYIFVTGPLARSIDQSDIGLEHVQVHCSFFSGSFNAVLVFVFLSDTSNTTHTSPEDTLVLLAFTIMIRQIWLWWAFHCHKRCQKAFATANIQMRRVIMSRLVRMYAF